MPHGFFQGSNKVNEMMDKMMDDANALISRPLLGGITVGLLVAALAAYLLFKRYS